MICGCGSDEGEGGIGGWEGGGVGGSCGVLSGMER